MVVQLATNTVQITMCVQNQWAFLKVEILNGFKWSISRRVNVDELFSCNYDIYDGKIKPKRKYCKIRNTFTTVPYSDLKKN